MAREVWITGIGITSSLGEGLDAHWQALAESDPPKPVIDRSIVSPYAVHPMVPLDLDKQIPKKGDQRQMENWQRVGTYSAGLAIDDAGMKGDLDLLSRTHLIVAASGGERDQAADAGILQGIGSAPAPQEFLNERLASDLRPTLFLAQLPNLLAGNISIVHKVTGSSRTFLGEETAGVSAVEVAARRIRADQGDIFLVGGTSIAERKDVLITLVGGGFCWKGDPISVWARPEQGGGATFGSVGAFLVLEASDHAEKRGRRPYAKLGPVLSDRSARKPGQATANGERQMKIIREAAGNRPLAVLSGATGMADATREERDLLAALRQRGEVSTVRGVANMLGSCLEANFAVEVGLAALALSRNGFYQPFENETGFEQPLAEPPSAIVATCWGIWRGEGI